MVNGITFSGLGSGLDTASIIRQLVALERLPLQAIQQQKAGVEQKVSALGTFKGLVKDLQSQAKGLADRDDLLVFGVSASQEGVASFSASGNAVAGSHTLSVLKLAAADAWAFDGVTDATVDLDTGAGQHVEFTVGDTSYSVTVQQGQSSLFEIRDLINQAAGDDVTATVVNAGPASAPSYRLVLTSNETGEDARITGLASDIGGLTIDGSAPDIDGQATSANNLVVGSNAVALVDGLQIVRESNELTDVVGGVTIQLESADPGQQIQFTVAADREAIRGKVEEFVEAYNAVIGFINQHSTYNEEGGAGGVLFGDPILRNVRSSIHTALFDVDIDAVLNDTLGFSTLANVGITKSNDGTLSIDTTKLDEKLAQDIDAFADLFVDRDGFDNGGATSNTPEYYVDTTADSGLMATLDRVIQRMFDRVTAGDSSYKGLFDSRQEAYDANMRRYDKQIEAKEFYLESFERNLVTRFSRLEELIGGLNSQGAALQSMLLGLLPR